MDKDEGIVRIELAKLRAHPKNANVTPPEVMEKLRRHIGRTGRYEPLVVRPHPREAGAYELINGHHRKEILESLGHTDAACVVWELSDAETLLLLATVNRLGGEDAPGKRLELLEALAAETATSARELAKLLPEEEATLSRLLEEAAVAAPAVPPVLGEMPEAFTVFMKSAEKARLVRALQATHADCATALLQWAAEHGA